MGFKLCVPPSKPLQMLKQPVKEELTLYIIFFIVIVELSFFFTPVQIRKIA